MADVTPLHPHVKAAAKPRGVKTLVDVAAEGGNVLLLQPARFVTIELAHYCTGYTETAIRNKIARSEWLEGREYVVAPDKRQLVDLRGVERWAQGRKS